MLLIASDNPTLSFGISSLSGFSGFLLPEPPPPGEPSLGFSFPVFPQYLLTRGSISATSS
nr:MAG: hypothetical protein [Bacteriophage sp.]